MNEKEKIVEKIGDVKIYGRGSTGGKGLGLVKINECQIPNAHKLRTRILTTSYFDRYIDNGGALDKDDLFTISEILEKLGEIPISVRSSATNEGYLPSKKGRAIHAGENTSFMLPNNHPDFSVRFNQLKQAIYHIYNDFLTLQPENSQEKMAIVINPIPGINESTNAGPIYYPLVSGIANSYFPYALKTQNAHEGFARIAFGHGYATVLDDFSVIPMITIRNPLPLNLLKGGTQQFFFALDMTKNSSLQGNELETMKKLNIRFTGLQKLKLIGLRQRLITMEELLQKNRFNFKAGLLQIMETISSKISTHYQIEFVFNIDLEKTNEEKGTFHVVQLTQLPEFDFKAVDFPDRIKNVYLAINSLQGHGIKRGIKYAVVVSPFIYTKDKNEEVRQRLSSINQEMKQKKEKYFIIVPGRLGSRNKEWGIYIDYIDIDAAEAIFEYGVDIAGRSEPLPEESTLSGGIYGSHFLYMIQGGFDEEKRRMQTRMYGTQGTHFLTNLMSNNVVYGYIAPNKDRIDPWFFSNSQNESAVQVMKFPKPVTIYADSQKQKCIVAVKQ